MIKFDFQNEEIVKRISILAHDKGTALTPLTKTLGLSTSSFSEWKKGKSVPSLAAIATIADYFDVSVDYLLFGKENTPAPEEEPNRMTAQSPREELFLNKFRQMDMALQDKALSYMEGMIAATTLIPASEEKRYLA